jgi:hypothetical protein
VLVRSCKPPHVQGPLQRLELAAGKVPRHNFGFKLGLVHNLEGSPIRHPGDAIGESESVGFFQHAMELHGEVFFVRRPAIVIVIVSGIVSIVVILGWEHHQRVAVLVVPVLALALGSHDECNGFVCLGLLLLLFKCMYSTVVPIMRI